ncbi:MAG TPA: response regulator [Gaiellaceae bacterium]|nr:response regulator [Gaiellaceae bacterium]
MTDGSFSGRERRFTAPLPPRVLIAEDETIVRLDLRGLLSSRGFEVVGEARNGIEAVERARALEPDLVLLDVKMPELDGIEAARRILAERPVPIVLVTAYDEEALVERAVDAGIFGYLTKPFREQDLLPAIRTALARHAELLLARRDLGAQPRKLGGRFELILPGSQTGSAWPLLIERKPDGTVDVELDAQT